MLQRTVAYNTPLYNTSRMETEFRIGHYPFSKNEASTMVHAEYGRRLARLLEQPLFAYHDRTKIFDYAINHFQRAESLFDVEQSARKEGKPNANLFYHGREHAVYQTGYDSVTIAIALLDKSKVARYSTPESILAILIAGANHDNGYVDGTPQGSSYAARQPIHVVESIRSALNNFDEITVPTGLSAAKIRKLIPFGIHATNFPFTQANVAERKEMLTNLDPKERKEAIIVALSVQLADLGGQVARHDYLDNLKDLRKEMNCAKEGLGDRIIGNDDEMGMKCKAFIENVIEKTVGRTANALFGSQNNPFTLDWKKHVA